MLEVIYPPLSDPMQLRRHFPEILFKLTKARRLMD